MHRRGVAQLVAHLLWEQEAGSSSLLSPTSLTRSDTVSITRRPAARNRNRRRCNTRSDCPNPCGLSSEQYGRYGSSQWLSRSNRPHHDEASVAVDRTLPGGLGWLCLAAALSKPEGKISGPILGAVEGEVKRDQLCLLACGDLSTEELAQARPIRCIRVGSFWVHRKPLESGLWSHHRICGRRVPDVHGGDQTLHRGPHLVCATQRRSSGTTGCGDGRIRERHGGFAAISAADYGQQRQGHSGDRPQRISAQTPLTHRHKDCPIPSGLSSEQCGRLVWAQLATRSCWTR